MNREKALKISWYIFLAVMSILTVLFFFDIKFMVIGINILAWDVLAAGIWMFVRLCKWAGRENTGRRTVAVIAITLVGLFAAMILMFSLAGYIEGTEPQTHRTFVVEYTQNMMNRGRAKLYERVGPLLFACDVDEYIGEFSVERPEDRQLYVSEDGKSIVIAYFFLRPTFTIPLEEPVEAEITPEQVLDEQLTEITPEQILKEQLIDDTHDAFLVDTGGKLGTLLVTAELERTPTEDCDFTVRFVVWNPASMNEPIQILTAGTNIFGGWNFIDANFDSYMDFTFTYLRGNASYYDHLWIWNEEYGEFVNISEYDKISIPSLDMETQTIYGFNRSSGSGTGTHTYHQWIEGDLLCIRCIDIDQDFQSKIFHMSVQDRIGGELAEIYQEDFAPESDKWHDEEMVWHDLDYHGEPGGIYDIFQQQPIDDTHDAFLVDTQGKLGTLLVTAELAMESKSEFGTRDITFTVWNPAEMEQPIQTFTEEFMMGVAPEFHDVADANFDGFQDFGYLFHAGNQPNYWRYWLWDEEQAQFMYYAPLTEVSQPVFDTECQIVKGWARSSAASGTHSFYRWMDGELVLVREIDLDFTKMIVVKDLLDRQMAEVYHEEWEEKDEDDVLDVLYKWNSLDYHGESMEEN